MPETPTLDIPDDLLAREAALRAGSGALRMRDAAEALAVPEAALLEARRATGEAQRLARPETAEGFGAVLMRLPEVGEVMSLTRNAACVHELTGRFEPPAIEGAMGQVVGEIDLRLFLRHWAFGYALDEETRSLALISLHECGHEVGKMLVGSSRAGTQIGWRRATGGSRGATRAALWDRGGPLWSVPDGIQNVHMLSLRFGDPVIHFAPVVDAGGGFDLCPLHAVIPKTKATKRCYLLLTVGWRPLLAAIEACSEEGLLDCRRGRGGAGR